MWCDATSGTLIEIKLCCGTTYSTACHSTTRSKQPFANMFSQLCNIIRAHNALLVGTYICMYVCTYTVQQIPFRAELPRTHQIRAAVRELHFNLFLQAQLCYENGNFVKLFCCIISPFCYNTLFVVVATQQPSFKHFNMLQLPTLATFYTCLLLLLLMLLLLLFCYYCFCCCYYVRSALLKVSSPKIIP